MCVFCNYHRHTDASNIMTPDSSVNVYDYVKRTKELDHKILSAMEHGFQGRYFQTYDIAKKNGLKFIFGTEAYWVKKISDGDYRSHYDSSFVYKTNQESIAKNNNLWLLDAPNISESHYNRNGVLIEAKVKPEYFMGYQGNDVHVKACTVIREVPKDEWEKWKVGEETLF